MCIDVNKSASVSPSKLAVLIQDAPTRRADQCGSGQVFQASHEPALPQRTAARHKGERHILSRGPTLKKSHACRHLGLMTFTFTLPPA